MKPDYLIIAGSYQQYTHLVYELRSLCGNMQKMAHTELQQRFRYVGHISNIEGVELSTITLIFYGTWKSRNNAENLVQTLKEYADRGEKPLEVINYNFL